MTAADVVDLLIQHYKENLSQAEIAYEDLCLSDGPHKFQLPNGEIELTSRQASELISRYRAEIAPLVRDRKRLGL